MAQSIVQLSLLPALEAAPHPRAGEVQRAKAPLTFAPPPTPAQIAYLKKLTRIGGLTQLKRFVARRVGAGNPSSDTSFTRANVAKVITMEVQERRLAA